MFVEYKIVIPVFAIVGVLFISGLSVDALADHNPKYDINKKAVLLKYAGNGGSPTFVGEGQNAIEVIENFIFANEGSSTQSSWNRFAYLHNLKDRPLMTWDPRDLPSTCDPCDWDQTIFDSRQFLREHTNHHKALNQYSKVILAGFSFGGGAATFVGEALPKGESFHQAEGIFLADPVGPGTVAPERTSIQKDCGTSQILVAGCNDLDPETGLDIGTPWRKMDHNIKGIFINYQKKSIPPTDFFDDFDRWGNHVSGKFVAKEFDCSDVTGSCHSAVGGNPELQTEFINFLKTLNEKPEIDRILDEYDLDVLETDRLDVLEGGTLQIKIVSQDERGFRESPLFMDLDVKLDSLTTGMVPITHEEFSIPSGGIATNSTFNMDFTDADGPSMVSRTAWVQDSGWPCDDCTMTNDTIDSGATGKWNSKNFTVYVINAPPTIDSTQYLFNGFEMSLKVKVSDPSTLDKQAGFEYEIDWGDGTVDNFHDSETTIASHLYKSGEYQIIVTATDKDGGVSEENRITIQTPFYNFTDMIDELVNDGTLNKGQGNSFNQKIVQAINSFEKTNSTPACNKVDAFINEVNAFVNSDTFSPDLGHELTEKTETEKETAGCYGKNTFVETNIEQNLETLNILIKRTNKPNEVQNTNNHADFFNLNSASSNFQTSDNLSDDSKGGGNEHLTRPTFGLSHETFETIVDSGFRFNDQSFTINDNHHTPFAQQTVNIGEVNSFEAKIYADKKLKVEEFLFGIPIVGEAHLAELGVEVWYDLNGNIEEVKAVQKSNIIEKETLVATHEKVKCQSSDTDERCDITKVSMVFLEPLKDKVMAIKAIDYKNRYQITYLNEGVDIAGESLNPMLTYLIPSNVRDGGLIKVTQLAKYSPYWESEDGRMFEMNSFGSFKEINQKFERFQDTGTAYTRLHSGFGGVIDYELKRATEIFEGSELLKELPDYIPYTPPEISERTTDEMKAKMLEQEEIAQEILDDVYRVDRHY